VQYSRLLFGGKGDVKIARRPLLCCSRSEQKKNHRRTVAGQNVKGGLTTSDPHRDVHGLLPHHLKDL
jgi:hypothetical protein